MGSIREERKNSPGLPRLQVRPGGRKGSGQRRTRLFSLGPRPPLPQMGSWGAGIRPWRRLWYEAGGQRGAEGEGEGGEASEQGEGSSRASASSANPGPLWPLVSSQEVIQKFLQMLLGPAGLAPQPEPGCRGQADSWSPPPSCRPAAPPPHSQLVQGQTVLGRELAGGDPALGRIQASWKRIERGT